MKEEIWKDIPNYEGHYQASNFGNVRSIKNGYQRILKQGIGKNKYPLVVIHLNGNRKTITVHKIIAITFLNHKPCGYKLVVDHIDNDKLNNKVENLQIITNRENTSKNRIGGSSKYIGVNWNNNNKKWNSRIYINNKSINLGYFDNELDAYLEYKKNVK